MSTERDGRWPEPAPEPEEEPDEPWAQGEEPDASP